MEAQILTNCWIQLVDNVVLDETGTITNGAPALTDKLAWPGSNPTSCWLSWRP